MKNGWQWGSCMSLFRLLTIGTLAFGLRAQAQTPTDPVPVQKKRPGVMRLFAGHLATWQEKIPVVNLVGEFPVQTQTIGFLGQLVFLKSPPKSRWRPFQSWDFGFGKLQGEGSTSDLPDRFDNQMWILAGASYGFRYRTSSITDIGLSAPLFVRFINWKLKPGTTTNPGRDLSATLGLRGHYVARIGKKLYLEGSVTHQFLWESTIWMVGLQYSF